MTLKIAFSVDDVCAKAEFGLYKKYGPLKYLMRLNEEFGCKFTLFAVPMYKEAHDISNFKEWVAWLNSQDYFEIAQHGYFHKAQKPEWEGQEYLGLSDEEVFKRIVAAKKKFEKLGVTIHTHKSPGWSEPKEIHTILRDAGIFRNAEHFIGTKPITSNGIIRIPYTLSIDALYSVKYEEDYLILHSHINPLDGRTKNAWNDELYESVRNYLKEVTKNKTVEYVLFKDIQ